MAKPPLGDQLYVRGGVNWGWVYWTWPFGSLRASEHEVVLRYPGGTTIYKRDSVRRVVLGKALLRGVRFQTVDGSESPAFMSFHPAELLARLRDLDWPITD